MYGKQRVLYPMKRIGERGEGKWERISWDQATQRDRRQVHRARRRVGPRVHHLRDGHADDPQAGLVSRRCFASPTSPACIVPGDLRRRRRPAGRRLHDARHTSCPATAWRRCSSRSAAWSGSATRRPRASPMRISSGRRVTTAPRSSVSRRTSVRTADALLEVGEPEAGHRHRACAWAWCRRSSPTADRLGLRARADRPAVPGAHRHPQVPARHRSRRRRARAPATPSISGTRSPASRWWRRPPGIVRKPGPPGTPPEGSLRLGDLRPAVEGRWTVDDRRRQARRGHHGVRTDAGAVQR